MNDIRTTALLGVCVCFVRSGLSGCMLFVPQWGAALLVRGVKGVEEGIIISSSSTSTAAINTMTNTATSQFQQPQLGLTSMRHL